MRIGHIISGAQGQAQELQPLKDGVIRVDKGSADLVACAIPAAAYKQMLAPGICCAFCI